MTRCMSILRLWISSECFYCFLSPLVSKLIVIAQPLFSLWFYVLPFQRLTYERREKNSSSEEQKYKIRRGKWVEGEALRTTFGLKDGVMPLFALLILHSNILHTQYLFCTTTPNPSGVLFTYNQDYYYYFSIYLKAV